MRKDEPSIPRRFLVEETASADVGDLQRRLGKKVLLAAIWDACPLRCQVAGVWHSVYLTYDLHQMPGRAETSRLWFTCLMCHRKVRKLYVNPCASLTESFSSLGCRMCLHLRYQSQNSWNRKWWRDTAMPLKRMLRRRERLIRRPSLRNLAAIAEMDEHVFVLTRRAMCRQKHRKPWTNPARRAYRDISLLVGRYR
jgi:hypothetical protein